MQFILDKLRKKKQFSRYVKIKSTLIVTVKIFKNYIGIIFNKKKRINFENI